MDFGQLLTNVLNEMLGPVAIAYALAAIGLNIHFGLTGLINMGQAGFMLLGAYGFAIATIQGAPLWVAFLVAIAVAVVFALLLGLPTLKLRGDYLAIVTIAATVASAPSAPNASKGAERCFLPSARNSVRPTRAAFTATPRAAPP